LSSYVARQALIIESVLSSVDQYQGQKLLVGHGVAITMGRAAAASNTALGSNRRRCLPAQQQQQQQQRVGEYAPTIKMIMDQETGARANPGRARRTGHAGQVHRHTDRRWNKGRIRALLGAVAGGRGRWSWARSPVATVSVLVRTCRDTFSNSSRDGE
jgi:hypothetical protein